MRKIILPLIILSLLFGVAGFAQEAELPNPGLTPDSPFYFFDSLGEKIGMFFTFGAEKKAERALQYAEEKLAEARVMAEKNKLKALDKANRKYEDFLSLANKKAQEAKERGEDVERLANLIAEKTLKHQGILLEVFESVPEQAKEGIESAIEMSEKGFEKAIEAVSGAKKEELQKRFKEITEKIPVYPGVSGVEVPLGIKEEIQDDLSQETEIMIYSSDDSPEKIENWYESQLTDKGWEKITEKYEVVVWKKGETGLGIVIRGGGAKEMKVEEEKTVILLVKDELEVWKKFLGILEEEKSEEVPKIIEIKPEEAPEAEKKEEGVAVPNTPMMLDIDVSTTAGTPYTIGWRAAKEATNYILERDTNSSFSNPIIVSSRTLNRFSETLSPSVSTRYYFRVKACNKYGCSSWSKTTELWVEVPPSITVTSPNGGEELIRGHDYTIRWASRGVKEVYINISFYSSSYDFMGGSSIAQRVDADRGFYVWNVSEKAMAAEHFVGSYYKIEIRSSAVIKDESEGYFSIVEPVICIHEEEKSGVTCGGYFYEDYCEFAPDGTAYANIRKCNASEGSNCGSLVGADRILCPSGCQNGACVPGIFVISPNGGEMFHYGEYFTRKARVDSRKSGELIYYLVDSSGNKILIDKENTSPSKDGQFYIMGSKLIERSPLLPAGTNYKAFVTFVSDDGSEKLEDYSDNPFSITEADSTLSALALISPNGGEIWETGKTYRLKWDSIGGDDSVRIYIVDDSILGSGSTNYIIPDNGSAPVEQGYYDWTIDSKKLPAGKGDNYKIRIHGVYNSNISDKSDAPFSIIKTEP